MTLSELFDKADEMVAKRYPDCNASIKEMNSYRDGYIHGMTEKLEGMIPIETIFNQLKDNMDTRKTVMKDMLGNDMCVEYLTADFKSVDELIGSFKYDILVTEE